MKNIQKSEEERDGQNKQVRELRGETDIDCFKQSRQAC